MQSGYTPQYLTKVRKTSIFHKRSPQKKNQEIRGLTKPKRLNPSKLEKQREIERLARHIYHRHYYDKYDKGTTNEFGAYVEPKPRKSDYEAARHYVEAKYRK